MAQFLTRRDARDMSPWMCIDEYTRFYLAFHGRHTKVGTVTVDFPLFRRWALDTLSGDVLVDSESTGGVGSYYIVWFSDEADIILFKLSKWYNEELNQSF